MRRGAAGTEFELLRSARRTLAVEVLRDGRVVVRAPLRMPRREIEAFVARQGDWIARQREKARQAEEVVLTAELERALRARAARELPELVREWEVRMGVRCTGISVTGALHRWGSCSSARRLCFSYRVLLLPPEERAYIVVHELAHLREMNHSARFYAVVGEVMPDWRERAENIRSFERTHRFIVPDA